MSLSIEHSKYFTQSYVADIQSAEPDAASGNVGVTTSGEGTTVSTAPPPPSSPQLLSDGDMRLLLLRDVGKEGIEGYKGILDQFFSDPQNRDDPVSFLNNLSDDGVALLKQAQSLPESASIDVNSLSDEEALNFILPHSGQVDLNNDGLVAIANGGKGFMFPPPNAPQSVKDAWADATANMSEKDRFLLSGKFMVKFVVANMHIDDNGKVTRVEPGDPDWRNVFSEADFSYRDAIEEFRAGNEFDRPYNTPEMYERMKSLLAQLDSAFTSHGVA